MSTSLFRFPIAASSLRHLVIALGVLAAMAGAVDAVHAAPVLVGDAANWKSSDQTHEAIFVGKEGEKSATLSISKARIAKKSLDLKIETDAKSLTLRSGDTSFSVDVWKGAVLPLTFDLRGETPMVRVAGMERPAIRGKWIRMVEDKQADIILEFGELTYASIKHSPLVEPAPEAPPAQAAAAPVAAPAVPDAAKDAPQDAAKDASQMLQGMKKTVFRIETRGDNRTPIAQGTGFVVSAEGLCITNFHVIHGASSAVAKFESQWQERAVELVSAYPELDLAILRVKDLPPGVKPAELEKEPIREGDDVYAIGYPLGLGFAINKGVVNGIRTLSDIPKELASGLSKYEKKSKWIQTDCTLNHGNSGGPLVNRSGHVVGVNTWGTTAGNNVYFSLLAEHVTAARAAIPATDLTFAAAVYKYGKHTGKLGILGGEMPHRDIRKEGSLASVAADSKQLLENITQKCQTCRGKGMVPRNVVVSTVSPVDGKRYQSTVSSTQACSKCGGKGLVMQPSDKVYDQMKKIVTGLGKAKTTGTDASDTLTTIMTNLSKALAADVDVRSVLTDKARGLMAQEKIYDAPAPVVGVGWILAFIKNPDTGAGTYFVALDGTNKIVIMTNPILVDPASLPNAFGRGSLCVFGGTCAGKFVNESACSPFMVMQDGFIVSPPSGGRWHGYYPGLGQ